MASVARPKFQNRFSHPYSVGGTKSSFRRDRRKNFLRPCKSPDLSRTPAKTNRPFSGPPKILKLREYFYHSQNNIQIFFKSRAVSVGGVMVSIDAFQALDPGSIPGHRNSFDDSPNSRSFYSNCINQSERGCRKRNDSKKK